MGVRVATWHTWTMWREPGHRGSGCAKPGGKTDLLELAV